MLRRQAAIALLVLCAAGVAHTQQAAREQKPVKEHTFDLESSYIRMPLPPGDEKYGRLDGYRMKEHVRAITAITRKYHECGRAVLGPSARIASGRRHRAIHRRAVPRVRTGGRDAARQSDAAVARHRLELYRDRQRHDADADVHLSGGRHVQHAGRRRQPRDRRGPASAPELDFAGRDVKGKLVFLHSDPRPNAFQGTARSNGAMQRAVQKGAAAVVVNVNIPGNITQTFATAPKVPTFSIGTRDAEELKALMAKGPVTVNLKMLAEERSGLKDNNVWGTLPGTSAEEIIITAHHDSRFEGAFDNASGIATMLGLAEYFSKVPPARAEADDQVRVDGDEPGGCQRRQGASRRPDQRRARDQQRAHRDHRHQPVRRLRQLQDDSHQSAPVVDQRQRQACRHRPSMPTRSSAWRSGTGRCTTAAASARSHARSRRSSCSTPPCITAPRPTATTTCRRPVSRRSRVPTRRSSTSQDALSRAELQQALAAPASR